MRSKQYWNRNKSIAMVRLKPTSFKNTSKNLYSTSEGSSISDIM